MIVAIGNDHAGTEYNNYLVQELSKKGIVFKNFGTNNSNSVDYPDYAHQVAKAVSEKEVHFGILICGSANGVAITANKHQQIRAALCWQNDIAELARQHNNANVICIPARFVSKELALSMVEKFLETPFEGGRHAIRVDKIAIN